MPMKKNRRIFLIIVIVFCLAVILKDQVLRMMVIYSASKITGAEVSIGRLSFGVINPSIKIKSCYLFNPRGFPNETLLAMPTIEARYKKDALFKKPLHLNTLAVDIQEIVVVKNKDGKLNIEALDIFKKENKPRHKKTAVLEVDTLTLNIDRVIYKDFTQGENPVVRKFDIGIKNKTYKNINNMEQLATIILSESLGTSLSQIKGAW